METESYLISVFGLDSEYYTIGSIGNVWNSATQKVYKDTGISVAGGVFERYFIDPADESLNGSIVFMIESRRVPHEIAREVEYWNAYMMVFEEVRRELGYPRMNLSILKIVVSYFVGL